MLFSRSDRTFQLELVREGRRLVERLHVGGAAPEESEHADEAAAIAAHRDRVISLLADDWTLAWAYDDVAWPVACEPAMEAAILDARDEGDRADRLAVYTDWLIERGDPCGELAVLRALVERASDRDAEARIAQLERRHADALFGPFAAYPQSPDRGEVYLVWAGGWIEGLDFGTASGTLVTLALHAPMARFLRRIAFRRTAPESVGSAIALAPRRRAIRQLDLPARISYAHELLDALPALEELTLVGGTRTDRGHARVRSLALVIDEPLSHSFPAWLTGAWPALERLRIDARVEEGGLAALLESADLPSLVELEVDGAAEAVDAIAEALPGWPLAELRRLRFSSAMSARRQRWLAERLPSVAIELAPE